MYGRISDHIFSTFHSLLCDIKTCKTSCIYIAVSSISIPEAYANIEYTDQTVQWHILIFVINVCMYRNHSCLMQLIFALIAFQKYFSFDSAQYIISEPRVLKMLA